MAGSVRWRKADAQVNQSYGGLPHHLPRLPAEHRKLFVLAVHTFLGGLQSDPAGRPVLGFANGLLLQLLNAKVIVYGLTLYSTFLAPLSGQAAVLAVSAAVFAVVGFSAVSTWALAGSELTRMLSRPLVRRVTFSLLALVLLFTAVESSGILQPLAGRPAG